MWLTLLIVLIADGLDLIDATITNIAAPSIVADIGGGPALVKWLGAAYALALGSMLVLGGRLGDRYGQRRVFLVGMAGFTLAEHRAERGERLGQRPAGERLGHDGHALRDE